MPRFALIYTPPDVLVPPRHFGAESCILPEELWDSRKSFQYVRCLRIQLDQQGSRELIWLGHDGRLLCLYWNWFWCSAPPGWVNPVKQAWEDAQTARDAKRKADEHRERLRTRLKPGKPGAKKSRDGKGTGDLIVDYGGFPS